MTIRFFKQTRIPQPQNLLNFSRKICASLKQLKGSGEICMIFVSASAIRKINRRFLGESANTDVIAFNYPNHARSHHSTSDSTFGDIFISVDTARRQAREGNHTLSQELALLIVHGLLHLIGYEDKTESKRKIMFAKQRHLFRKINLEYTPPDFR